MTSLKTAGSLQITTPSRLHFGLFGFGAPGRQFGGVGAMIQSPGLRLRVTSADRFSTSGPLAHRVAEFAGRWCRHHGWDRLPACRLEVLSAPCQHVGLGVGTQLGMAVAAGLCRLLRGEVAPAEELARSVGRGRRSAVGTYGFEQGGLILERGKLPHEALGPLVERHPLPAAWRFVLIQASPRPGLSGNAEQQAFDQLPTVAPGTTQRLWHEARDHLVPSVVAADFEGFSESVYRFGRLAGSCFAERQGGAYNGPQLHWLVRRVRTLGVRGVGQSSWGPTLFAVLPDQAAAENFCREIAEACDGEELQLRISPPANDGASIERLPGKIGGGEQ